MPMLVEATSWPEDFQVLLQEISEAEHHKLRTTWAVRLGKISDHWDELHQEVLSGWSASDWTIVHELLRAYTEQAADLPPLVAQCDGGLLRDGYHRAVMYRICGIEEAEFIYLDEQE